MCEGWPWELTDSPEIWSAFSDGLVAVAAVAGLIFLLVDRFRPRGSLFGAWARSHPTPERNASRVEIFAVSMMPEPALLLEIRPEPGCEIALVPSDYSLETARLENVMYPSMPAVDSQLTWLPTLRFTRRPRMIGGPAADPDDYRPVTSVFVRGPASGSESGLKLTFALTSDSNRRVEKRVVWKARHSDFSHDDTNAEANPQGAGLSG